MFRLNRKQNRPTPAQWGSGGLLLPTTGRRSDHCDRVARQLRYARKSALSTSATQARIATNAPNAIGTLIAASIGQDLPGHTGPS